MDHRYRNTRVNTMQLDDQELEIILERRRHQRRPDAQTARQTRDALRMRQRQIYGHYRGDRPAAAAAPADDMGFHARLRQIREIPTPIVITAPPANPNILRNGRPNLITIEAPTTEPIRTNNRSVFGNPVRMVGRGNERPAVQDTLDWDTPVKNPTNEGMF
jgi:hypothetical protein